MGNNGNTNQYQKEGGKIETRVVESKKLLFVLKHRLMAKQARARPSDQHREFWVGEGGWGSRMFGHGGDVSEWV